MRCSRRRAGWAPGPEGDPRYDFLLWAFAIEPRHSLGALVAFNGLGARVRRAFFAFVLDGQGVEQCLALGLGPREQLHRDLRAGDFTSRARIERGWVRVYFLTGERARARPHIRAWWRLQPLQLSAPWYLLRSFL